MRYAIFSDIHNNTTALSRILTDADTRQVQAYLCLGDVGVDQCVELVRNRGAATVFGNWEVSNWRLLSPGNQRWALNLPPVRCYDGFWISHAAPVWPKQLGSLDQVVKNRRHLHLGGLFPYYLNVSDDLWRAFAELTAAGIPLLFHGHTHRQIGWSFTPDNRISRHAPVNLDLKPDHCYIIGVGSVGQPKDFTGPAYIIFDAGAKRVEFIRLPEP